MQIASECRVPVYPISRGQNWGYGSATPSREGSVVLDLSRMNRIIEIDEKLAYAVIEPGVTQRQLYEALQARGGDVWPDATGAGPNASIVGNFLDRGFGHTPAADHQNQFAGIEAVLGNGELIRTGYASLGANRIGKIARGGPGAGIDTMLIQSNLAVVTRMAVWLYPRPEACTVFVCKVNDEAKLPALVEAMRKLRFEGVLTGAPHLANDYRVLGLRDRFPYDTADPTTGLTDEQRAAFRRQHGVARWTLLAGIYGPKVQVRANIRRARTLLRGVGKVLTINEDLLNKAQWVARFVPMLPARLHADLESASEMLQMLSGDPVAGPMQAAYWRHRTRCAADGGDPLSDRVGYRGISPVIPFTGEDVVAFDQACEAICKKFGFEFALTITNLVPRHGICVVSITYDRENEAEEQRAIECVDKLTDAARRLGCEPYRLPTWGMAAQSARWPTTLRDLMLNVKTAFDPQHIIAPGRYLPSEMSDLKSQI